MQILPQTVTNNFYPVPRRVYRHFKGNYYYVLCVAQIERGGDMVVVYHSIESDQQVYVRPVAEWMEVITDHEENITGQHLRFELVELGNFLLNTIPTVNLVKELSQREDRPDYLADMVGGKAAFTDFVTAKVLAEGQENETLIVEGVLHHIPETALIYMKRQNAARGKMLRTFKRVYIEITGSG